MLNYIGKESKNMITMKEIVFVLEFYPIWCYDLHKWIIWICVIIYSICKIHIYEYALISFKKSSLILNDGQPTIQYLISVQLMMRCPNFVIFIIKIGYYGILWWLAIKNSFCTSSYKEWKFYMNNNDEYSLINLRISYYNSLIS